MDTSTKFNLTSKIYLGLSIALLGLYIALRWDEPAMIVLIAILVAFVVWNYPTYKLDGSIVTTYRVFGLIRRESIDMADVTSTISEGMDSKNKRYLFFVGKDEVLRLTTKKYNNMNEFAEACIGKVSKKD